MSSLPLWEVVGGEEKGGILVRTGQDTRSKFATPNRLATGAIIRQRTLTSAGRLEYELVSGEGPTVGWVSTKAANKDLLRRADGGGGSDDGRPAPSSAEVGMAGSPDTEKSRESTLVGTPETEKSYEEESVLRSPEREENDASGSVVRSLAQEMGGEPDVKEENKLVAESVVAEIPEPDVVEAHDKAQSEVKEEDNLAAELTAGAMQEQDVAAAPDQAENGIEPRKEAVMAGEDLEVPEKVQKEPQARKSLDTEARAARFAETMTSWQKKTEEAKAARDEEEKMSEALAAWRKKVGDVRSSKAEKEKARVAATWIAWKGRLEEVSRNLERAKRKDAQVRVREAMAAWRKPVEEERMIRMRVEEKKARIAQEEAERRAAAIENYHKLEAERLRRKAAAEEEARRRAAEGEEERRAPQEVEEAQGEPEAKLPAHPAGANGKAAHAPSRTAGSGGTSGRGLLCIALTTLALVLLGIGAAMAISAGGGGQGPPAVPLHPPPRGGGGAPPATTSRAPEATPAPAAKGPTAGEIAEAKKEAKLRGSLAAERASVKQARDALEAVRAEAKQQEAELRSSAGDLDRVKAQAEGARRGAAAARQQYEQRHGAARSRSQVEAALASLPLQRACALLLGVLGGLGSLGPSSYVRGFLSVGGSAVAGLLSGGCVCYFFASGSATFLDSVQSLVEGDGPRVGYYTWLILLLLGVLRWAAGVEIVLYNKVSTVDDQYQEAIRKGQKPVTPR